MIWKRPVLAGGCVMLVLAVAASTWAQKNDAPLPRGTAADRILIEKAKRALTLFEKDKTLKTYQVALGREPVGAKRREGDGRTPEGIYIIAGRKPDSAFHRALRISYPNDADLVRARATGEPPGGDIMIHGLKNGLGWLGRLHTSSDWTEGCIAVTNEEIEEIWDAVPDGTPVEIVP
ncbi:MAG TPA: L,D-transpeptidase family protein [Candidatus Polarisedimenticolaceae bacterium]|nr:L,D-transpeptidase family protein [Candidatus Polarisedimenticolaceae bacterium]